MDTERQDFWQALQAAAATKAAAVPLLSGWLSALVTSQPTLGAAIACMLAEELADQHVSRESWRELLRGIVERAPEVELAAAEDLRAFASRDPSCEDALSALLNYKGFRALQCHRMAHVLWHEGERALARYLQGRLTMVFSIDIHPAARIGRGVFVDHGTAIVIGETAVVEDNVSILHSVTLGGTGKATGVRHPTIREGVMIGAGAAILGHVEIGAGSKIAAGSVVLGPVAPHTTVAGVPARVVGRPREERPSLDMDQWIEEHD
jgi:serine O-acetyltransferase